MSGNPRRADNVVHFARVLRTAGLAVGTDRINNAIGALEIVRLKAPGASERLYRQVVEFVQRMRRLDLFKSPGVAETIDWTNALVALNAIELDPVSINDTLGVLLKYQDDIARMQEGDIGKILDTLRARQLVE